MVFNSIEMHFVLWWYSSTSYYFGRLFLGLTGKKVLSTWPPKKPGLSLWPPHRMKNLQIEKSENLIPFSFAPNKWAKSYMAWRIKKLVYDISGSYLDLGDFHVFSKSGRFDFFFLSANTKLRIFWGFFFFCESTTEPFYDDCMNLMNRKKYNFYPKKMFSKRMLTAEKNDGLLHSVCIAYLANFLKQKQD